MTNNDHNIQIDLENILKSVAEAAHINKCKVSVNINETQGDGFLSEFFTGEILNIDDGKTTQVAIKKAPVSGSIFEFGFESFYKNEVYFYSKVFPTLNQFQKVKSVKYPFNNVATYLAGNVDPKNMFVAMENLKTAGYVLVDKRNYLDSGHLEFIFKTYGKFHALSFTFKRANAEKYENLTGSFTGSFEHLTDEDDTMQAIENAYLGALKMFDPISEADILAKLRKHENVKETFKNALLYNGNYKCLIHGDCWSNNMMFKYKESGKLEDMKLIDFQFSYSSTPVRDLSYFFYTGASKDDMDKLDYYLDLYYQSFSDFTRELGEDAEEIFPLDILKKEWREHAVFGVYLGCQVWQAKLMDKDEILNILNQNGLPREKYADLWTEKLTEITERADYIERARNLCLHAVEYGILL